MSEHFTFIPKNMWGSVDNTWRPMMAPRRKILFVHHTVTQVMRNPCANFRIVENVGLSRFGYGSYNYLQDVTGVIGEMQGGRVGAHTAGRNSQGPSLALIGNYEHLEVSDKQIEAACHFADALRAFNVLDRKFIVLPHMQVPGAQTACSGKNTLDRLIPWLRLVGADPLWGKKNAA